MPCFERDWTAEQVCRAIRALPLEKARLMEVCGTHTVAIARSGIRRMLPPCVELLSGPGCPVCVTPASDIDAILALSAEQDIMIATYGDMLRVPGSRRGDSLRRRSTEGAQVRMVYSPLDAVALAERYPGKPRHSKNAAVLTYNYKMEICDIQCFLSRKKQKNRNTGNEK